MIPLLCLCLSLLLAAYVIDRRSPESRARRRIASWRRDRLVLPTENRRRA